MTAKGGFTLLELMVSMSLGLIILGMALSSSIVSKRVYKQDLVRTKLNQNLRSAMNIVNLNTRQAGENLPALFPAVEVINGTSGAPDEIILRRNLLDDVLKLCSAISSGSSVQEVYFAISGTEPGCAYGDNVSKFSAWQTYRNDNTGTVDAFIYDSSTQLGEYFSFDAETDNGVELFLNTLPGTWVNSYTVGQTAIYLLEEWHFRLTNDLLELIVDQDTANPLTVVNGISDFQVLIQMQNGTTLQSFSALDNWTQIRYLQLTLGSEGRALGDDKSASVTSRFFPRNVLSN